MREYTTQRDEPLRLGWLVACIYTPDVCQRARLPAGTLSIAWGRVGV